MIVYLISIMAVLTGYLIIKIIKPRDPKKLKLLLAFSGAFLLAVTVFNLLPALFSSKEYNRHFGIWIMSGILLQKILEYLSKGAETRTFTY